MKYLIVVVVAGLITMALLVTDTVRVPLPHRVAYQPKKALPLPPPGITEIDSGEYYVQQGYMQNAWHLCEVADEHGGGVRHYKPVHGGMILECYYVNDHDLFRQPAPSTGPQ